MLQEPKHKTPRGPHRDEEQGKAPHAAGGKGQRPVQLRKALHSANKQQLLPYSPQVNTSQGQHGSARSAAAPPQLPLRHSSFHHFPSHTVEAPHTQRSPTPNTPAPRDCANPSPRTRLPPNRLLCVRRGHGARAPHIPPSLPPSFRAGAERPPAPAARRMRNPGREAGRRAARRRSARFLAPLSVPGRPPTPPLRRRRPERSRVDCPESASPAPPPPPQVSPGPEERPSAHPQAQVLKGWRLPGSRPRPAGPSPGPALGSAGGAASSFRQRSPVRAGRHRPLRAELPPPRRNGALGVRRG